MPLKIRERDVEEKVVRYARSRHCMCLKFSSPSHRGVCDRIIITPNGQVLFLELKAPKQKPTALQLKFLEDVAKQGGVAWWSDDVAAIRLWLDKFINLPKSHSRPYNIWANMRDRCENPTSVSFPWYGAKGISVCPEWQSFLRFWSDMSEGYADELQLDRKDPAKGYAKDNCRWVTAKEQARNRSNSVSVMTPLGEMLMVEACELFDVDYAVVQNRIMKEWPEELWFSPVLRERTPFLLR